MKKYYSFMTVAAAMSILLLSSCVKESEIAENQGAVKPVEKVEAVYFTADFENAESKASVDGRTTVWEAGDEIMVYAYKSGAYQAGVKYIAAEGGSSVADFGPAEAGTSVIADAEHYVAVYPAALAKGLNEDGTVKTEIPVEQSMELKGIPMLAKFSGKAIKFRNICSIVELPVNFTLLQNDKMTLESSQNVAGDVTVSFNEEGIPSVTTASAKTVSATVSENASNLVCRLYLAPLAPDASLGFNLDAADGTNIVTKNVPAATVAKVVRNTYVVMPESNILIVDDELTKTAWGAGQTVNFNISADADWRAVWSDEFVQCNKKDANTLSVVVKRNPTFAETKSIKVKLMPDNDALADRAVTLTINQSRFYANFSGNPAASVDADGAATVTDATTWPSPRYYVKNDKGFGLGTYVWKFKSVNIQGKGSLLFWLMDDLNKPTAYYMMTLGEGIGEKNGFTGLGLGGETKTLGWNNAYINTITELKIEVLPKADDETSVVMKVYVNGELAATDNERKNFWNVNPSGTMHFLFGLQPNNDGVNTASTIVIKSMEYFPYTK